MICIRLQLNNASELNKQGTIIILQRTIPLTKFALYDVYIAINDKILLYNKKYFKLIP